MTAIKQSNSRRDWLNQWLPITLIMLLATGLYLYQLGTESMWVDELYSINDAKGNLSLYGVRPIYFILLKFWMLFGTSDSWLRSLSVVFGLGSVFLTYQLGRRIAGETTGLIASLLLALSPLFINYAQMVRMYSLATCLSIGGSLALVYALENPTNSSMAWWACLRVLSNMTAPLNVTLMLPDVLIFFCKFRKQRDVLFTFGKWLLLAIILWLPSLWKLLSKNISIEFLNSVLGLGDKAGKSSKVHELPSIRELIRKLKSFTAFPYASPSKLISLFYRIYSIILLFLLSFSLVKKHRSVKLLWVAAWAFIPAIIISLVSQKLWNIDRYTLFLCPYIVILLAAGFMRLWNWQSKAAIVVAVIYLFAVGNGIVHYYKVQDHQDWRGLLEVISTTEKPGDKIVVSQENKKITTSIAHYYNGTSPVYSQPGLCSKYANLDLDKRLGAMSPITRLWLICRNHDFDEHEFQKKYGTKLQMQKHWAFPETKDKYSYARNFVLMHLYLATPNSNIEEKNQ